MQQRKKLLDIELRRAKIEEEVALLNKQKLELLIGKLIPDAEELQEIVDSLVEQQTQQH